MSTSSTVYHGTFNEYSGLCHNLLFLNFAIIFPLCHRSAYTILFEWVAQAVVHNVVVLSTKYVLEIYDKVKKEEIICCFRAAMPTEALVVFSIYAQSAINANKYEILYNYSIKIQNGVGQFCQLI